MCDESVRPFPPPPRTGHRDEHPDHRIRSHRLSLSGRSRISGHRPANDQRPYLLHRRQRRGGGKPDHRAAGKSREQHLGYPLYFIAVGPRQQQHHHRIRPGRRPGTRRQRRARQGQPGPARTAAGHRRAAGGVQVRCQQRSHRFYSHSKQHQKRDGVVGLRGKRVGGKTANHSRSERGADFRGKTAFDAPVARSDQTRGPRHHRAGYSKCPEPGKRGPARRKTPRRRHRTHRENVRPPANGSGFQRHDHQTIARAGSRPNHPFPRRGRSRAGAGKRRFRRPPQQYLQRVAGPDPAAGRQHHRNHRRVLPALRTDQKRTAAGHDHRNRPRQIDLRPESDHGSGRNAGHCHHAGSPDHLFLFPKLDYRPAPADRYSRLADRGVFYHVPVRFFHQCTHPAGHRAGYRFGGGRRDCGHGEYF